MKHVFCGWFGVIMLASAAAAAASNPGSSPGSVPVVVTPALVNRLAEEMRTNLPALRAAGARNEAARASLDAVRTWEDPMLKLGALGARAEMRADEGDLIYGVEQKLPLFGKPELARRVARAEWAVEQARAEALFQVRRRDLATALFRAALAEQVAVLSAEDLPWLEALAVTMEKRYPLGEVTQAQLLRVQNERAKRASQLLTDQQRRTQEWGTLNRLLGREVTVPWPALELPAPAGPVAFSERLADYALRYEPRLKVLRQQVQQAETSVARTRRQRYPDLLLGTEARNYSGNGGFRQAMVTVSFNVPWGNAAKYRGEVRREQALLQAAELETRDYEQSVREEVYRVTVALEAARREAVLYRDEIVPRSGQALAAAHAAWMANRGLFNDVLEARRLLIDARLMYTRAVAEQWELLSDLVLCCGLGDLEALQMIGAQPPAKE